MDAEQANMNFLTSSIKILLGVTGITTLLALIIGTQYYWNIFSIIFVFLKTYPAQIGYDVIMYYPYDIDYYSESIFFWPLCTGFGVTIYFWTGYLFVKMIDTIFKTSIKQGVTK